MTNIGLQNSDKIIKILEKFLASESIHNLKIRKYHRNIKSMKFKELHTHFEDLYNTSYTRIDDIAEIIRTLDALVIGTYKEYLKKSFIEEDKEMIEDESQMIKRLLEDKKLIIREMRTAIEKCSEYCDIGTEDLLTGILTEYEKDTWMLRSMTN